MKLDYIEYILTIKINKLELVYTSKSYYEIENEIQHFLEKYSDYNLSFNIDVGWKEEKLQKEINSQTEQNSDKEVAQPYSKSDKTTKGFILSDEQFQKEVDFAKKEIGGIK